MSPNYEQGFLAVGPQPAKLPYEAIQPVFYRAIQEAIRRAWTTVLNEIAAGRCIGSGEKPITIQLETALNNLLNEDPSSVPGFSGVSFDTVIRGGEVVSFDGTHIEKRPDLTFRLSGRRPVGVDRTQNALFVECKFVADQRSMRAYCDDGIMRFVRGEYAWAMPHAMMIGYVATTKHGALEFRDFLVKERGSYHLDGEVGLENNPSRPNEATLTSRHLRPDWQYPATRTDPGSIDVLHLWLSLC